MSHRSGLSFAKFSVNFMFLRNNVTSELLKLIVNPPILQDFFLCFVRREDFVT